MYVEVAQSVFKVLYCILLDWAPATLQRVAQDVAKRKNKKGTHNVALQLSRMQSLDVVSGTPVS